MTPELEAWLEARHDPKWKCRAPKPRKPRYTNSKGRGKQFQLEAREYDYRIHNDYRTLPYPLPSLEAWMTLKSKDA